MLPEQAPFTADQRQALDTLISSFSPLQRGWLSGYLASAAPPAAPPVSAGKLTVLYGTESGNSESLATRAAKEAAKRGFKATVKNMSDLAPADLAKVSNLLVIVSTWGDGEPPESAARFYKELMGSPIALEGIRFSVCALGDSSYEKFCQTGKDIDARLEVLGAKRASSRKDCDVDYEDTFTGWLTEALSALAPASSDCTPATQSTAPAETVTEFGKKNPFPSELLDAVLLNGKGSSKETLHLELSLAGSGMSYEPGDALAVVPVNAPDVVQAILNAAKLTGNEEIDTKVSGSKRLADALREDFDITALSRNVLTKLAEVTNSPTLNALLADDAKDQLKQFVDGRQIIDALVQFAPSGVSADALSSIFRKLPPRLYSIASSPLAHPDEVHLTVSAVRYFSHGLARKGVCSTFLADLLKPGDLFPVFVQPNKNFRLPDDASAPVIMVGPGTGIAPFRAFVEHRAALGASGKNWLFMGDQHYLYDFLYQLEWQEHLKSGALTRLDVAFSRDQPEKIYVQQRIAEHGAELFAWLEQGAYFYVCGDAIHMAADVHESLISIVSKHGGKSRDAAESYVEELKKSKRYQRDVY